MGSDRRARSPSATRGASGWACAAGGRRCLRRLLLVQRPRARARARADAGRDGAGGLPRRHRLRDLHQLVVALGGHETAPWHYLGGEWAAQRYERRHRRPAKNRYGVSLFPLHIGRVLGWARLHSEVDLLDAFPRYYPYWTRPLVRLPGIREVATWNLVMVLRRRADESSRRLGQLAGATHVPGPSSLAVLTRTLSDEAPIR